MYDKLQLQIYVVVWQLRVPWRAERQSLAEVSLRRHANIRFHPADSFSPHPKRAVWLSLTGPYDFQASRRFLVQLPFGFLECSDANHHFLRNLNAPGRLREFLTKNTRRLRWCTPCPKHTSPGDRALNVQGARHSQSMTGIPPMANFFHW